MDIQRKPYGKTKRGEQVDIITAENDAGLSFSLITYGATITSVKTPDREGRVDEITLGFDRLEDYEGAHPYFGATVGRFANRIRDGLFTLDGKIVRLDRNKGPHHLHGGTEGFSRKVWEAFPIKNKTEAGGTLSLTSIAGEMGFPGNLEVRLTVMLSQQNELSLSYEAKTDAPTPVNLTNHTYWNLAGQCAGPVYDHQVRIHAGHYLEADDEVIPTGRILPITDGPFDFREPKTIGRDIDEAGGYDHCFTLSEENALSLPAAEVYDPASGRKMTLFTISPGLQFYSGNFLSGIESRCGAVNRHEAFCLETEEYPDAVNHDTFPDVILRPDGRYLRKTVYLFS